MMIVSNKNSCTNTGLYPARIKNLHGFIDKTGKIVIKMQFDRVKYFREGLAAVKINSMWDYIDKQGKIVIAPQFDQEVGSFHTSTY